MQGIHLSEKVIRLHRDDVICDDETDHKIYESVVLIDRQVVAQLVYRIQQVTRSGQDDQSVRLIIIIDCQLTIFFFYL